MKNAFAAFLAISSTVAGSIRAHVNLTSLYRASLVGLLLAGAVALVVAPFALLGHAGSSSAAYPVQAFGLATVIAYALERLAVVVGQLEAVNPAPASPVGPPKLMLGDLPPADGVAGLTASDWLYGFEIGVFNIADVRRAYGLDPIEGSVLAPYPREIADGVLTRDERRARLGYPPIENPETPPYVPAV